MNTGLSMRFLAIVSEGRTTGSSVVAPTFATATVSDNPADSPTYTTLAAAEAALTAPFTVWVKSGTYAGATLAKVAQWIFEPGTIINTTALTVSGNKVGIHLMPGCDIQVAYEHSGTDAYIEMMNGVASVGLILSAARPFVSGGGWGSIMDGGAARDAIAENAADALTQNITVDTTSGNSVISVDSEGARAVYAGVKHVDSDGAAFDMAGADALVLGGLTLDSDGEGVLTAGLRNRVIGNNIVVGTNSVDGIAATDDNNVVSMNIVNLPVTSGDGVDARSGAENTLIVANRLSDPAADNSSGASGTLDANDLTDF